MTIPFIAIIPVGPDWARVSALTRDLLGYKTVFESPGLLIVTKAPADTIDLRDHGVVIGTAFDRAARAHVAVLPDHAIEAARGSSGESLFTQFWGGYVALLALSNGEVSILRDPSGAIPCWWSRQGDAVIVTSAVRDCVEHGLLDAEFDWATIAGHLLWPERHPARTAISGVAELIQGSRLRITAPDVVVEYPWMPWDFTTAAARIDQADDAIDLVRRVTLNSVHGWTKRYQKPLVSLSGGLDSSIVLAGVKGVAGAAAVTISTNEPIGDERTYARAAAQHCAIDLVERQLRLDDIVPETSHAATCPRPVARLFGQGFDRLWREAASALGSDALFHGGGGDNVFCYLTSAAPYLDSLLCNGLDRTTAATLFSLSEMVGVSTWRVRRGALRKFLLDRGQYRWVRDETLLSTKAKRLGDAPGVHPWFDNVPAWTLPGKRAHVAALVRIRGYLDAIDGTQDVPVVAPLMAQAVMEACLRIPSWLWCTGGFNRSIARAAFSSLLPTAIIERHGKGSPDAFEVQILAAYRSRIRDMLLGGMLAAEGLIDRERTEDILARPGPTRGLDYLRIADLVDVEAWLQSWAGLCLPSGPVQS